MIIKKAEPSDAEELTVLIADAGKADQSDAKTNGFGDFHSADRGWTGRLFVCQRQKEEM